MSKLLAWVLLVVASLFSLSGCGGNGSTFWSGDYPEPAIYNAAYNRGGGKMTITVGKNALVSITIVDDVAGTYFGTGNLRSNESFSVKVTGPNNDTLIVDGSLTRSALSKNYLGKAQGSITFTYDAPLAVGNIEVTTFAGNYSGTADYRNFDSLDAVATIDPNGFIDVLAGYGTGSAKMKGLIYSDGHVILQPQDGEKNKLYGKGVCYLFYDLKDLQMRVSLSTTKDGKEIGVLRLGTAYGAKR